MMTDASTCVDWHWRRFIISTRPYFSRIFRTSRHTHARVQKRGYTIAIFGSYCRVNPVITEFNNLQDWYNNSTPRLSFQLPFSKIFMSFLSIHLMQDRAEFLLANAYAYYYYMRKGGCLFTQSDAPQSVHNIIDPRTLPCSMLLCMTFASPSTSRSYVA